MSEQLSEFRRDPFIMRHVGVEGAALVEQGESWTQAAPAFVVDLSCTGAPIWRAPTLPRALHATCRVRRNHVLLFGPNHLVASDGSWTCETGSRPGQHIAFYNSPAYHHIYKGPKPVVRSTMEASAYELSIEHVPDSEIATIDRDVFLATPLEPDNWGRWLSTVIPKVAFFRARFPGAPMQFLCRAGKPWQLAVLATLGIESDILIQHDPGRTYFCPRVNTLAYSAADLTPSAGERDVYASLVGKYGDLHDRRTRLYVSRLSRSAAAPRYRVLTNEAVLVEQLAALGFQVINPELHSFTDQVRMFAAADFVLGLGGAGMFNVVFCRPGTKVVTIESSDVFINDHSRLFAACGLPYGVIFGRQDADDLAPVHKRWSIDIDGAVQAIKSFL